MTKYWFRKRKGLFAKSESPLGVDLGWGWVPISWEGWLLVGVFVFALYYLFTNVTGFTRWIYFGIALVIFMYFADTKTEDKVLFKRTNMR